MKAKRLVAAIIICFFLLLCVVGVFQAFGLKISSFGAITETLIYVCLWVVSTLFTYKLVPRSDSEKKEQAKRDKAANEVSPAVKAKNKFL